MRTSMALTSFGVLSTQLYILQKLNPTIGAVAGSVCAVGGILIVLVGCVRYFRVQGLLVQRKMRAKGWDLVGIWVVLGGVLVGGFVVGLVQR